MPDVLNSFEYEKINLLACFYKHGTKETTNYIEDKRFTVYNYDLITAMINVALSRENFLFAQWSEHSSIQKAK